MIYLELGIVLLAMGPRDGHPHSSSHTTEGDDYDVVLAVVRVDDRDDWIL